MKAFNSHLQIGGNETAFDCRIDAGLLLGQVAERIDLARVRYLLVEDISGHLLGIVDSVEVQRRLSSNNEIEQQRWAETPLEAIVQIRLDPLFGAEQLKRNPDGDARVASSALVHQEQLLALDLGDDLMVRWSIVENVLKNALYDSVTGLPNRSVFDRRLVQEWERVKRRGSSIAVLMIDLDHFKQINDRYGHSMGDEVLTEVAETLSGQLRSYDLLVRFGGDEFAAILTDCYMTDIHIPATRLQEGIRRLGERFDFEEPPLTVSIGAATCPGNQKVAAQRLVDAADECMYAAKKAGRGCAYTLDIALSGKTGKPRPLGAPPVNAASSSIRVPRPQ
ncbi:MAG: GGDEF domain-containing protein [Planctomycetaceae bacterium]